MNKAKKVFKKPTTTNFKPSKRVNCSYYQKQKNPSFDTIKETLLLHNKGLGKFREKVALVCLLSYLIKVGASEYFFELSEFSVQMQNCLTPFPLGLPEHLLISIQMFHSILQAKFLVYFIGSTNESYSMWKSSTEFCKQLNKVRKKLTCFPPIIIKTANKNLTIECESDVFMGLIEKHALIESNFLPLLLNQLIYL